MALLSSCASGSGVRPPALPDRLEGWTRLEGPETVTRLVPVAQAGWRWSYAGTSPMQLTVYRMPSQTSAFAAVQNWRAVSGQLAFYKGAYFGIVESAGAGYPVLARLVAAAQAALPDR